MSAYKQFSPKDYAVVPFNANKQYTFNSSSADLNQIKSFSAKWSSNPIDTLNKGNIKYQQTDHLFYKNYLTKRYDKLGDGDFLHQSRILTNEVSIISIPTGLYGHKIKPQSLKLHLSNNVVLVDDPYGNLIIEGTNLSNYITNPQSTLLKIGPDKGFKKYNLNINKRGLNKVNKLNTYTNNEYDDSIFLNQIHYKDVNFSEKALYSATHKYPGIDFNGTNSEIKIPHNSKFNFNPDDDFSIEFWVNIQNNDISNEIYLIGKSTTETILPSSLEGPSGTYSLSHSGSSQLQDIRSSSPYPFEITVKNDKRNQSQIFFKKFDGEIISTVKSDIPTGSLYHVICQTSNKSNQIWINGELRKSITQNLKLPTQNNANIYIGNKGGISNYFSGSLSQIKINNQSLNKQQIQNHYYSSIGSPYTGNIFYSNGLIVIPTQISKQGIGAISIEGNFIIGEGSGTDIIKTLSFQGSHLIYENEYKCTIDEFEFNNTLNPTARKLKSINNREISDFATGSLFKPYITTVGLYNENNELLVVGKLGQPIRTSNETDTTIVLRWDT
jgi:hypothetical protein